jgi:hypothetical protein
VYKTQNLYNPSIDIILINKKFIFIMKFFIILFILYQMAYSFDYFLTNDPAIQISPSSTYSQIYPCVVGLGNGNFVIAWSSQNAQSKPCSYNFCYTPLIFNAYNSKGNLVTTNSIYVQPLSTISAVTPSAHSDGNGGFKIIYDYSDWYASRKIYISGFDVNLTPMTAISAAGRSTSAGAGWVTPIISKLANGGFVAVWLCTSLWDRVYDSNLAPQGGLEFNLSRNSSGESGPYVVGLQNGGFIVSYSIFHG